jgi:uncharacterized membrane protein HdeD (DUF308 family)
MKVIENIVEPIRAAARTIFILGIVLVILGILSILAPLASGLAVQALIGVLMIAAGITWVTFSFHAHSWGSGLWEALVGVAAVVTGVLMLGHPLINLAILTLVLAAYFIATGILKIVFAFHLKPLKSWGWVLFNGIVAILLGVLITYQWPFSGLWAIGTLFGVDLLFGGFSLIALGSSVG